MKFEIANECEWLSALNFSSFDKKNIKQHASVLFFQFSSLQSKKSVDVSLAGRIAQADLGAARLRRKRGGVGDALRHLETADLNDRRALGLILSRDGIAETGDVGVELRARETGELGGQVREVRDGLARRALQRRVANDWLALGQWRTHQTLK